MLQFLCPNSPERLPALLSAWCNTTKLIAADHDFVRSLGLYFILYMFLCLLRSAGYPTCASCPQILRECPAAVSSWNNLFLVQPFPWRCLALHTLGMVEQGWGGWGRYLCNPRNCWAVGIAGLWPCYLCSGKGWRPTVSEDFPIFSSLLAPVKQFPWDPLYPFVLFFFSCQIVH